MALTYLTDRVYSLTAVDDGNFLVLGNGDEGRMSAIQCQFQAGIPFNGTITVLGVSFGKQAADVGMPFLPICYQRMNIAGVASDGGFVPDTLLDTFSILIPSNGLTIALLVGCPAGSSGTLAFWPLVGGSRGMWRN